MNIIKLKKGCDYKVNGGHPWVYSNEIDSNPETAKLPIGSIVKIVNAFGQFIGTGYYNRHCLMAIRILSRIENEEINENFFINKIKYALKSREQFFTKPFYRLVHSEADGIAGLIIDRFDNLLVLQLSTAGIENLSEILISALNKIFNNPTIILRNDIPARKLEGLEEYVKVIQGNVPDKNFLIENDLKFYFNPIEGQKTGWFFDQRENRKFISSISEGKDVLDTYCYNGGFGINALSNNAKSVTFIDSSELAISNVKAGIELNKLDATKAEFICDKVFDALEKLMSDKRRFDVVVLDPPAFIKSKKDLITGLKGYEKLARMGAKLVADGGYLLIASCSHNAQLPDLIKATATGINKAERSSKIIRIFGAGADHPMHPFLSESEYLKSITYQLN